MPAVQEVEGIEVVAVAEQRALSKLDTWTEVYPMATETDFNALINREDVNALYVPQPPALHFEWAKKALEAGKDVLIEKPSTVSYEDSKTLVDLAREKGLALHENYMFQYHLQIQEIKKMLAEGVIGDVRLFRADFGFPLRQQNDFRYIKALGGGALLDAAGYPVKLATLFLGDSIKVDASAMSSLPGYEVDMLGSIQMSNDEGKVFQIGYGMDNGYRCSLEVWGSKGKLSTNRIFTAPPGFEPVVKVETAEQNYEVKLAADSHFEHSIEAFVNEVNHPEVREAMYQSILTQARLIEEVREKNVNK